MFTKKNAKLVVYGLALAAGLGTGTVRAWAADGVLSKDAEANGTYCHLKFPAIRPSTLDTDNRELKRASTGDVIDYYGPCDHDPKGGDEVISQKDELDFEWDMNYASE